MLNNTLAFAVRFAMFAERFKIHPRDLAQMIQHAESSKRAYERGRTEMERQQAYNIESIADKYGLKVDWPGLWPMIKNVDGLEDMLPSY